MSQEQEEPPVRRQYAGDLANGGLEWVHVLERQAQDHRVEARIRTGQLLGPCPHEASGATTSLGRSDLRRRRIDSHHVGAEARHSSADLALATPHVQDTPCSVQEALGKGKNLFLVFRVDPVGESLLPPCRMLFPKSIPDHHR